jgi:hypothetical protein
VAGGTVTADAGGDLAGVSADWDGHGWGWDFSPILFGGTPPQSAWLTCIRQGFCLAVGLHGAATWTAARGWSDVSAGLGFIGPAGCGSPASCMIVGVLGTRAYAWNGSSWLATPAVTLPGVSRLVSAVSCGSPSSCIAVGRYNKNFGTWTLADLWNGKSWRLTKTLSPQ